MSELGAQVVALDIQERAIQSTQQRVEGRNVTLHCMSHVTFPPLTAPPRLIVYNLGYLPGGDKHRTTLTQTTLLSLQEAERILAVDGAISITCYSGHEEGEKEERAVLQWAKELSSSQWLVSHHSWLNRPHSPSLLWLRRSGSPDKGQYVYFDLT
ncbi:MAG: class I SAM-dependent methyltransferase [Chlamydiia bacterium]|nr:class I SAM-dependent methyltransferase [Chlamydiia bacterium]